MKVDDRFLPRVWDGERYWYPCFSELGITYQCDELPLTDETIKDLDWAFEWYIGDESLQFNHIVEACTGMKDESNKLVFEGDIIEFNQQVWEVFYSIETMEWGIKGETYSIYGSKIARSDMRAIKGNVVGNIHQDKELLDEAH